MNVFKKAFKKNWVVVGVDLLIIIVFFKIVGIYQQYTSMKFQKINGLGYKVTSGWDSEKRIYKFNLSVQNFDEKIRTVDLEKPYVKFVVIKSEKNIKYEFLPDNIDKIKKLEIYPNEKLNFLKIVKHDDYKFKGKYDLIAILMNKDRIQIATYFYGRK